MSDRTRNWGGRTRMGGFGIAGICFALCGFLTLIWGGTVVPVSLTSPDFMSFATGGLVLLAIGRT